MKDLLSRNRKAVVGLLTPAVVFVGAKAGLSLTPDAAAGVASFVTAVAVWMVPNSYGKGLERGPDAGNVQYEGGLVAGSSGTTFAQISTTPLQQRAAEVHSEARRQTATPRKRSRKKG